MLPSMRTDCPALVKALIAAGKVTRDQLSGTREFDLEFDEVERAKELDEKPTKS